MVKASTKLYNVWEYATIDKIDKKNVWLGNTLYICYSNPNVEILMLKSAPKTLIFFPSLHIIIILMCNFFLDRFEVWKKRYACQSDGLEHLLHCQKFTKNCTANHFLHDQDCTDGLDLVEKIVQGLFVVHGLLVKFTFQIFCKWSCRSHLVALWSFK